MYHLRIFILVSILSVSVYCSEVLQEGSNIRGPVEDLMDSASRESHPGCSCGSGSHTSVSAPDLKQKGESMVTKETDTSAAPEKEDDEKAKQNSESWEEPKEEGTAGNRAKFNEEFSEGTKETNPVSTAEEEKHDGKNELNSKSSEDVLKTEGKDGDSAEAKATDQNERAKESGAGKELPK